MAWQIFAPGRVTYHRVIGAALLYLTIAVILAALYTFIGSLDPAAFVSMKVEDKARERGDPFQLRDHDHDRIWRRRAAASRRAKPVPMEGDAAGTSGHARDRALQSGLNAIRESFRRCSHQDATKLPDLYNATLC
ncbi:hypothetical protein [Bradyrhizobium sp. CCBAU 11434]|uniref:hypothetical protein n=1 Tax=Bradyrhizobium sp. CCBAU 11434 TaxID=1630885 RepID=UPI0023068A47|nr:hypothetical protein [Bradyrhizobium sp. CCBAU 11434]